MSKQVKRNWLMRIFGRKEDTAGDMEIADDLLAPNPSSASKTSAIELDCADCAGNMEIVDATLQRENQTEEKKKIDQRLTSGIKRANGGG